MEMKWKFKDASAAEYFSALLEDNWILDEEKTKGGNIYLLKEGFTFVFYNVETERISAGLWGPDQLVTEIPMPYSYEIMVSNLRKCKTCGREDIETTRYSFAGRCCHDCLPELRRVHEYPGWTN